MREGLVGSDDRKCRQRREAGPRLDVLVTASGTVFKSKADALAAVEYGFGRQIGVTWAKHTPPASCLIATATLVDSSMPFLL
jgi:hypothetical protein